MGKYVMMKVCHIDQQSMFAKNIWSFINIHSMSFDIFCLTIIFLIHDVLFVAAFFPPVKFVCTRYVVISFLSLKLFTIHRAYSICTFLSFPPNNFRAVLFAQINWKWSLNIALVPVLAVNAKHITNMMEMALKSEACVMYYIYKDKWKTVDTRYCM